MVICWQSGLKQVWVFQIVICCKWAALVLQTPPRVITLDNYNFPSATDEDYQRQDLAQPLGTGSANRTSQINRPLDLSADQRSAPTVQFRFVWVWFVRCKFYCYLFCWVLFQLSTYKVMKLKLILKLKIN